MSASLGRDVVILACAISAGIHGALTPGHLAEGAGAGAGFAAATGALALLAFLLTRFPGSDQILVAAALALAALIASYAFAVTTGLPGMHPEPEPVDGLALVTKAIEGAGVLVAWRLLRRRPATALIHAPTTGV